MSWLFHTKKQSQKNQPPALANNIAGLWNRAAKRQLMQNTRRWRISWRSQCLSKWASERRCLMARPTSGPTQMGSIPNSIFFPWVLHISSVTSWQFQGEVWGWSISNWNGERSAGSSWVEIASATVRVLNWLGPLIEKLTQGLALWITISRGLTLAVNQTALVITSEF